MTDDQALELLRVLLVYYESADFDPLDPAKVTVAELGGDLADSLPRTRLAANGLTPERLRGSLKAESWSSF